jgi:hypothetical protein
MQPVRVCSLDLTTDDGQLTYWQLDTLHKGCLHNFLKQSSSAGNIIKNGVSEYGASNGTIIGP